MTWTIVKWQIVMECPSLMDVLSEADNAKHDTFRKESALQTLFNIHQRCMTHEDADPKRIGQLVARSKDAGDFKNLVGNLIDFVMNFSGGKQPHLLQEMEEFSKQLALCREVPLPFYGLMSKLPLRQAPLYVIALVKATMACPEKYMCQGQPKIFGQTDLNMISGRLAQHVKQACTIMKKARGFLKAAGIPENDLSLIHI